MTGGIPKGNEGARLHSPPHRPFKLILKPATSVISSADKISIGMIGWGVRRKFRSVTSFMPGRFAIALKVGAASVEGHR